MSVKKTNLPAIVDEIPKKNMLDLVKEKMDFVIWVKNNVKSESMRKMALEHASFYYLNIRYEMATEMLLSKLERVNTYKRSLAKLCHEHRIKVLTDYQKLKTTILQANKEKTQLLNVTDSTLLPIELQKERIEAINEQEKRELRRLHIDQKKRRFYHKALSLDAAERAKLRSDFITQMKNEIDDPEILEDAIDEYDRIVNQSQMNNEE